MARHDNNDYTRHHAQEYVHYFGCWWSSDKEAALLTRDPREYAQGLRQLIEANEQRSDPPGQWETWAAEQMLEAMGIIGDK